VTEPAQQLVVVGPALPHLDPGLQVHAAAEHLVERKPRGLADRLEAGAACADHDLALADALHPDDGIDLGAPVRRRLETLDLDCDAVRQLVRQRQHQLLAQGLGGKEALGPVGHLLRRIDRIGLGQQRDQRRDEPVEILAALGRDRHDGGKTVLFRRPIQQRQQPRARPHAIDLVHREHDRAAR
jgi:hypothetical protein